MPDLWVRLIGDLEDEADGVQDEDGEEDVPENPLLEYTGNINIRIIILIKNVNDKFLSRYRCYLGTQDLLHGDQAEGGSHQELARNVGQQPRPHSHGTSRAGQTQGRVRPRQGIWRDDDHRENLRGGGSTRPLSAQNLQLGQEEKQDRGNLPVWQGGQGLRQEESRRWHNQRKASLHCPDGQASAGEGNLHPVHRQERAAHQKRKHENPLRQEGGSTLLKVNGRPAQHCVCAQEGAENDYDGIIPRRVKNTTCTNMNTKKYKDAYHKEKLKTVIFRNTLL